MKARSGLSIVVASLFALSACHGGSGNTASTSYWHANFTNGSLYLSMVTEGDAASGWAVDPDGTPQHYTGSISSDGAVETTAYTGETFVINGDSMTGTLDDGTGTSKWSKISAADFIKAGGPGPSGPQTNTAGQSSTGATVASRTPMVILTMSASPLGGRGTVTPSAMSELLSIIRARLAADGITDAKVTSNDDTVTVSAAALESPAIQALDETALLRFRQVLAVGTYSPSSAESPRQPAIGNAATSDQPLPNSEAPTLSTALEASFANWDCSKNPNPTNGNDVPTDYIIACDPTQPASEAQLKYLLAPTAVEGTQVKTATAGLSTQGVDWQVNLSFNGSGSSEWLNLTKTAYNATGATSSGFGTCSPPKGCNAVAIVLDGVVKSAPAIQSAGGIPGGMAQITGQFNQQTADQLAANIKFGSLPLVARTTDVETIG